MFFRLLKSSVSKKGVILTSGPDAWTSCHIVCMQIFWGGCESTCVWSAPMRIRTSSGSADSTDVVAVAGLATTSAGKRRRLLQTRGSFPPLRKKQKGVVWLRGGSTTAQASWENRRRLPRGVCLGGHLLGVDKNYKMETTYTYKIEIIGILVLFRFSFTFQQWIREILK